MDYREVLNDLVEVNNDRIAGYEKAISITGEKDLLDVFNKMITQSEGFAAALKLAVETAGEDAAEGTSLKGKIYRTWMDIKSSFGGDDRKSILESCEYSEDAAKQAYQQALKESLPVEIFSMVNSQYNSLMTSHDTIKKMRNRERAESAAAHSK